MQPEIAQQLLDLNRHFYEQFAGPFAETRAGPQPGFYRLVAELPRPCDHLLDVGCGDGRLGRFLLDQGAIEHYTGVDFSPALLAAARAATPGVFVERELSRPGCLDGLGRFEAIACLSTLQHIPGRANRLRLLQEMATHLAPQGRVILANWQFLDSPRQRRKVVEWSTISLPAGDVEPNDYLLTWRRGGQGLRYVCLINEAETTALAQAAGLAVVHHFRSDGKEGNLNLYTVCRPFE